MAAKKKPTYNVFLDASMLRCPIPMIEARKKLKELNKGQILLIKTSEPSFNIDFAVLIQKTGNQLLDTWKEESMYFNLIKKLK